MQIQIQISLLIMSHLAFSSFMCSVNCPSVDIVIPGYLQLSVICVLPAFTFSLNLFFSSCFNYDIFCFFRPKGIFFCLFHSYTAIPFFMCFALHAVAMLSINTGILFILPYLYFTSFSWFLTLHVSVQHMMGPNTVPCFTTSLMFIFAVVPTGVLIIIYVSSFISYKHVCLDHSLSYTFLIDIPLSMVYSSI